jgi:hypothetical protein
LNQNFAGKQDLATANIYNSRDGCLASKLQDHAPEAWTLY